MKQLKFSFFSCEDVKTRRILRFDYERVIKILHSPSNGNRNENMAAAMFILFITSISHFGFKNRKIKVPSELLKDDIRVLPLISCKLKMIKKNDLQSVDVLPCFEQYFLEVISLQSRNFTRKIQEIFGFKTTSQLKRGLRFYKDTKEKFIFLKKSQNSTTKQVKRANSLLCKIKTVNFWNPSPQVLSFIVFFFVTKDCGPSKTATFNWKYLPAIWKNEPKIQKNLLVHHTHCITKRMGSVFTSKKKRYIPDIRRYCVEKRKPKVKKKKEKPQEDGLEKTIDMLIRNGGVVSTKLSDDNKELMKSEKFQNFLRKRKRRFKRAPRKKRRLQNS